MFESRIICFFVCCAGWCYSVLMVDNVNSLRRWQYSCEGKRVASSDEKRDAIVRGFLEYKPDATESEISDHVSRFMRLTKPSEDAEIF